MKTNVRHSLLTAFAILGLLSAGLALAAPPASVTGTWTILGNVSTGSLKITQGAASSACKPITGTIYGSDPVIGYYCPTTGRIAFLRKNTRATPDTTQTWVGNLSEAISNQPLRMGGTFHALNPGAGSGTLGEYNFNAQK